MNYIISGRASRSTFCPPCNVDRRGVALLADVEASTTSLIQADFRPHRLTNPWHSSMGG